MLRWTVEYRTAEADDTDPGPLLDALAELARAEAAVVTVTDSCGEIVLDVAPDDELSEPGDVSAWPEHDLAPCVRDGEHHASQRHPKDECPTMGEPDDDLSDDADPDVDDPALDAVREMPDPRDDALDSIAEILRHRAGDPYISARISVDEIVKVLSLTGRKP